MRSGICLLVLLLTALALSAEFPDLSTGRRIALVIGNNNYQKVPALKNSVHDADDMAANLTAAGFQVSVCRDVNGVEFERALQKLKEGGAGADVALFYFSGHGFQIAGENYLAPVDAGSSEESILRHQCISCEMIREVVESSARFRILVFDACRNNPFASTRGGSRGLSTMQGQAGTIISLATGPGSTASDNEGGRNGLYTKNLLTALQEPGLDFQGVFRRAGELTYEDSSGSQQPWVSASVIPFRFRFRGEARSAPAVAPASGRNDQLAGGASLDTFANLTSGNGRYRLSVQGDGNLVLYRIQGSAADPIWSTQTHDPQGAQLTMNKNGILSLVSRGGSVLWNSSKAPAVGTFHLEVQNDGNLVIYGGSTPTWTSQTAERQ